MTQINWMTLMLGIALAGCTLDNGLKNHCAISADCNVGNTCIASQCVNAAQQATTDDCQNACNQIKYLCGADAAKADCVAQCTSQANKGQTTCVAAAPHCADVPGCFVIGVDSGSGGGGWGPADGGSGGGGGPDLISVPYDGGGPWADMLIIRDGGGGWGDMRYGGPDGGPFPPDFYYPPYDGGPLTYDLSYPNWPDMTPPVQDSGSGTLPDRTPDL